MGYEQSPGLDTERSGRRPKRAQALIERARKRG